ncbi:MAG: SseB family protein [Chthoniobacteraceae bacterium]
MQTIPLAQLEEMFASLRTEDNSIDGEMLWGYYFTASEAEALEPVAEALEELGYDVADIFESEEEPLFILQAERFEKHTPETLFALNAELEALAAKFPAVEYDGMDVNSLDSEAALEEGEEGHGCCGGHGGEGCGCGHGDESKEKDHECCGGKGGESKEKDHECCGGSGEGCCGRHVQREGEAIENPQIIDAIERISTDRSEDAQREMTLALQRGLYLVPVFSGRLDTEPTDDQAVQVLVCTDENNDEYLPLFTDEEALKAWTQENVSAMVLTAPEAWDFILTQPECAGGVLNPGSSALPLNRDMVGILKKMIEDHEQENA